MLPFFLYLAAGAVTGFHLYILLAMSAHGVAFNSLELLSLLGSLGLVVAAIIALFKPHAAARIALVCCLLIWSFYGPASAKFVRSHASQHSVTTLRSGQK
jgi:hypothetical protein